MLETIRDLLSSDGTGPDDSTPTPDAVREAIDETESELERARERLDELNDRHGEMLLHAGDEALDDHERKIELTEREVARLTSAKDALDEELEAARHRQKVASLQATLDEAQEANEEGEKLLAEFAKHAEELVAILDRIKELDSVVSAAEHEYQQAEREVTREVDSPDGGFLGPARPNGYQAPPITESTEIPPVGPDAARWGSVRWREPRTGRTSTSPDSSDGQRPAGVYDAESGEPVDGDDVVPRRGTVSEGI